MISFPKIVAIINTTPDSFSDGGKFTDTQFAVEFALKAFSDGVDIVDIGGESTRPGANAISPSEELHRVMPVIEGIRKHNSNAVISVDTTKAEVAQAALKAGANIINDISGGTFDDDMFSIVSKFSAKMILMHTPGPPEIMQSMAKYGNAVKEVAEFLQNQVSKAESYGINHFIIDPCIGFGKLFEHNIEILRNLDYFYQIKKPILLGVSRKSFLGKITGVEKPQERDTATILLHSLLLKYRIDYIRIHNYRNALMLKNLQNEIFFLIK